MPSALLLRLPNLAIALHTTIPATPHKSSEHRIREPATEGLVVLELLEELGVVFEHRCNHPFQGLVVLDLGILPVGVLFRVFVGLIFRDLLWNLTFDAIERSSGSL